MTFCIYIYLSKHYNCTVPSTRLMQYKWNSYMSWVNNSVLSGNQLREGDGKIYNNGSFSSMGMI